MTVSCVSYYHTICDTHIVSLYVISLYVIQYVYQCDIHINILQVENIHINKLKNKNHMGCRKKFLVKLTSIYDQHCPENKHRENISQHNKGHI